MLKTTIALLNDHPRITAWTGAVFGWLSFDLLRAAQIFAALTAGCVSVCALILTAPKAYRQVRSWLSKEPPALD